MANRRALSNYPVDPALTGVPVVNPDGTVIAVGGGDVDVLSEVASAFDHVANRDVDTTAEQLTATSMVAKFGVLVKTDHTNAGIVYVGNADVTAGTTDATDGLPLRAGEAVLVKVDNANKVYVIGSAANQIVYALVV